MRTLLWGLGVSALIAAAGVLWVGNCSGPRPEVADVTVEASESPDHAYRISVVIINKGRNGGEVTVLFELVSREDGRVTRARENIEIEANETLTVSTEISAPPGAYDARAKVDYPPR
jgi:hypothetical protein